MPVVCAAAKASFDSGTTNVGTFIVIAAILLGLVLHNILWFLTLAVDVGLLGGQYMCPHDGWYWSGLVMVLASCVDNVWCFSVAGPCAHLMDNKVACRVRACVYGACMVCVHDSAHVMQVASG